MPKPKPKPTPGYVGKHAKNHDQRIARREAGKRFSQGLREDTGKAEKKAT